MLLKKHIPFFSCDTCKEHRDFKMGKCPFDYKPNLNILMRRNYNLCCISCGDKTPFNCPAEKIRVGKNRKPICFECFSDIASAEYDQFMEDKWMKENPGLDPEEEHRNQVYLQKYGEY